MEKRKTEYRKVEKAKILKSVRDSDVPYDDYLKVKRILLESSDNETAIENSIKGLSEEDEFAMVCRLMKTATHLIPLEQRSIIRNDEYITPDFLSRFQPGCSVNGYSRNDSSGFKCFVEVKSTTKDKFKIGGSRLRKLRNFADEFGFPLLFAIRFLIFERNAFWIVVEDSDRTLTSLTVTMENLLDGVRHIIWDEYWYMLWPGTLFKGIFDSNYSKIGVKHPEYGTQREFQIMTDGKIISFDENNASLYSAFFEAFELEEVEVKRQGSITHQVLAPKLLVNSMVDLVYKFNRLPIDEQGRSIYDASKMIKQVDRGNFDIEFIQSIADSLSSDSLLMLVGFCDKETHLKKWRQFGGQK